MSAPTPTARQLVDAVLGRTIQTSTRFPSDALATRVEAALAILARYRPAQNSGSYDGALLVEEIQGALDGRQA